MRSRHRLRDIGIRLYGMRVYILCSLVSVFASECFEYIFVFVYLTEAKRFLFHLRSAHNYIHALLSHRDHIGSPFDGTAPRPKRFLFLFKFKIIESTKKKKRLQFSEHTIAIVSWKKK